MDIKQFFNYLEEPKVNSVLNIKNISKSVVVQNP